jgi:hypothetical protein
MRRSCGRYVKHLGGSGSRTGVARTHPSLCVVNGMSAGPAAAVMLRERRRCARRRLHGGRWMLDGVSLAMLYI